MGALTAACRGPHHRRRPVYAPARVGGRPVVILYLSHDLTGGATYAGYGSTYLDVIAARFAD